MKVSFVLVIARHLSGYIAFCHFAGNLVSVGEQLMTCIGQHGSCWLDKEKDAEEFNKSVKAWWDSINVNGKIS